MSGKKIVILDYDMGNTFSISNALTKLGYESIISSDKETINNADALILPGVGAFKEAMFNLKQKELIETLNHNVLEKKKPILGICLGMQLMANSSEEMGETKGLGWIEGEVKTIDIPNVRVPHVGWNSIEITKQDPLYKGLSSDIHFYFDHSYHFVCKEEFVSAYTLYDELLVASIQKENILATQFHPEKSQTMGLKLLRNFLNFVEEYTLC